MQAVSQNAQDKICKLEAEASSLSEELATQRRALETAWSDNTDLKRAISELKAEKEDLRGQVGVGESA
jgi:predicted  nucleic acid-binding Zn-ribbon protein